MRKLLLTLLLAGSAWGQVLPWVDLAGQWKMKQGDDPAWSQPEFDDSGWGAVQVPFAEVSGLNLHPFWLRRTVTIPAWPPEQPLTLTLGRVGINYEVFVNGQRVATIGRFDLKHAALARPRSFDLPRLGSPLVIAVRVVPPVLAGRPGATAWVSGQDPGPWLITGIENAPRNAGRAFLDALRLRRSLDLLTGSMLLALALIPLLIFLYQSQRRELLWLALHAAACSVRRLMVVVLISADAAPWNSWIELIPLHWVLLVEFVLAALAIPPGVTTRVMRLALWVGVAASYLPGGLFTLWPFRAIEVLTVCVLPWALVKCRERTWEQYFIVGGSLLIALVSGLQDYGYSLKFGIAPTNLQIGPYQTGAHPVLVVVFTLAMVLILTKRLVRDSAEKERMAGDLEAARTIQTLLIAHDKDNQGPCRIEVAYQPAQEVGGDLHWTRYEPDGALMVVVGDVSGKGLKAAMLVSVSIGILRTQKLRSPAAILAILNDGLIGHTGGGFVTCCCARFDVDGTVTLANGGNPAPYCDGSEVEVEAGLPLGLVADVVYQEIMVRGERFTFVSDGVVEAANPKDELFGFERTREISGKSAQAIAEAAKAWGQNDDITVVTVRRLG